jgi:hypothetical protein
MKFFLILSLLIGLTMTIRVRQQFNASMGNATNRTMDNATDRNMSGIQEFIPKFFFVNELGRPGREYIAFKNVEGYFLGCDNKTHNLTVEKMNITLNELWVPVLLKKEKKIALRNYFGGYLTFNNTMFDCKSRRVEKISMFEVEKNIDPQRFQLANVTDKLEILALKIKDQYLGMENRRVLPVRELNKSAILFAPFKKQDVKNITEEYYFEPLEM